MPICVPDIRPPRIIYKQFVRRLRRFCNVAAHLDAIDYQSAEMHYSNTVCEVDPSA